MTTHSAINIKVSKNDNILKNINEKIHLNTKNWTEYIKSLKNVQKNVNTYLTELVEEEKNAGEYVNVDEEKEEECDESDEDDENAERAKRKLEINETDGSHKKTKA
ncbi:hypothetical protein Zmor_001187 [Zophobas morio]|uniref:Uncharacterized protein n=1 Tax=Zophobas morio TaxID=2755281 RepID=A0AA38J208_9CUCU|nr:hypothetical protein Zmor_001187 [Zophobas morio]